MTQQPYYPPQQPQQQPQGYPPQPPAQYPPQYPQAPQPMGQQPAPQYAPQPGYAPPAQYGQPQSYGQPPVPPAPPLAQGSLDEFYSQPSAGAGPGIGWSDKQGNQRPLGTTWVGLVARDVSDADVQQMTDMRTGQPVTYRDGRPKFQMKVPLKNVALFDPQGTQLQLPPDMPEGEGTWYVKGQAREELTRAMAEASRQGAPVADALLQITLVNRRATGGGMNPANIVQVRYLPPAGGEAAAPAPPVQQPPQPAPVQQQAQPGVVPEQTAVPGQALPPLPPQTYPPNAQPLQPVQQQEQPPQWAQPQPQPAQMPLAQPVQQPQYQVPPQQVPGPPAQPPQFDAEQAALFARITGQPQQAPQQGQPAA